MELDEAKAKLNKQSSEIADLKDMLDTAQAYESMMEELSERNIDLGERVEQLEAENAELEELRDVSEEMEQQHLEYEAEIRRDAERDFGTITELKARTAVMETKMKERDEVILKFRDEYCSSGAKTRSC